jgi:hypothetical protein
MCVCGRKKLPFAGYSVEKEHLRLKLPVSSFLFPVTSLVERRFRGELLSKFFRSSPTPFASPDFAPFGGSSRQAVYLFGGSRSLTEPA